MLTLLAIVGMSAVSAVAVGARRKFVGSLLLTVHCPVCGRVDTRSKQTFDSLFVAQGIEAGSAYVLEHFSCSQQGGCGSLLGYLYLESQYVLVLIEKIRLHDARMQVEKSQLTSLPVPMPPKLKTPLVAVPVQSAPRPSVVACQKCTAFFGPGAKCTCFRPQEKS